MFIPCFDGVDCWTFRIDRPAGTLSVIAGHFGVTELDAANITDYQCVLNMRDPVDRATSCLYYFYEELFQDVDRWSVQTFRKRATEEANRSAICHNDAARMLINIPGLNDQDFLKASQDKNVSTLLINTALSTLRRCIIIDLFDVTSDEDWRPLTPTFLSAWFPWLNKGQALPWANPSTHSLKGKPMSEASRRLPHRLIDEVEKMNSLDMEIYKHAVALMRQQRTALREFMTNFQKATQHSRKGLRHASLHGVHRGK